MVVGGRMKISKIDFIFYVLLYPVFVSSYIQKERGFFYNFMQRSAVEDTKKHQCNFEKKQDGTSNSAISLIHSYEDFKCFIDVRSYQHPVVIKLFSEQNIDSIRVKNIYQEVAEYFGEKVAFAAVDIIKNNDVFIHIMAMCRLTSINLPLFLFFKEGYLHTPSHEPSPMIQGYLTKENLKNFIKHKFMVQP
jgi:hypothetical protein